MRSRGGMDYPKTERQAQFIALAESLAGPIAARAEAVDRAGTFPFENFREMHEAGMDLLVGSDVGFDDRQAHELKGVPGTWRLFAARPS